MTGTLPQIHSADDMIRLVESIGFLPFFANHIPGFSVEECCPRELWFAEGWMAPGNGKALRPEAGAASTASFLGTRRVL